MAPNYSSEFITLAAVHFLVLVTPGADFAMIVRQSLVYGRRTAILSSVGVGLGMLLHCAYTIVGLGLVISRSAFLYTVIKVLGAGYLFYIGYKSLRARKAPAPEAERSPGTEEAAGRDTAGVVPGHSTTAAIGGATADAVSGRGAVAPAAGLSPGAAIRAGFLVNALNPKATLFFLSIFTAIVSPGTPVAYQLGYSAWIFTVQAAWFSFVSLIFSHPAVRGVFGRLGHWMERLMGAAFIALGFRLLLSVRS